MKNQQKGNIRDDEPCVVFCNFQDAEKLLEHDEKIEDALVISKVIPQGKAVIVPKADFLHWLYEGDDYGKDL